MEETYTFTRALHLMRYGGKKMRPVSDNMSDSPVLYIFVRDNKLLGVDRETGEFSVILSSELIMGSWAEVK